MTVSGRYRPPTRRTNRRTCGLGDNLCVYILVKRELIANFAVQ